MNIELKLKFNYRYTVFLLTTISLFIGAIGIAYRAAGIFFIPFIASFLATLFCVEKKKIAFITTSVLLFSAEIVLGFIGYFSLISLSSIALATIIAICYLKDVQKSEAAIYSTIIITVLVLTTIALLFMGINNSYSLKSAYDKFVELLNTNKQNLLASFDTMPDEIKSKNSFFTSENLDLIFNAFLDSIIALVTIASFLIVGITYKLFSKLLKIYSKNTDMILSYSFLPARSFAIFYFVIAFLSVFTANNETVISISIMNLFLIFELVFAYVGYKFLTAIPSTNNRKTILVPIVFFVLICIFSSFALQLLAIVGAFICLKQPDSGTYVV